MAEDAKQTGIIKHPIAATAEHVAGMECPTCVGLGLVDAGTCPDCMGCGDKTDGAQACRLWLNQHVGQRCSDDRVEDHVLGRLWGSHLYAWAEDMANQWLYQGEALDADLGESAFCESHECGGCDEVSAPCESFKLWTAGMLLARVLFHAAKDGSAKS